MTRIQKVAAGSSRKADKKLADDLSDGALNCGATSVDDGESTMGTRSASARRQLVGEDGSSKISNCAAQPAASGEVQISTSTVAGKTSCPKASSSSDGLDDSFESMPTSPNELTSSPLKVFKCSHCPFSCNQIVKLDRHQNKHYIKADHQASNFNLNNTTCTFCSFSCRSSDILDQHLRLHTTPTAPNMLVKNEKMELQQQKPPQTPTTSLSAKLLLHEGRSQSAKLEPSLLDAPCMPKPLQNVAVDTLRAGPSTPSLSAPLTPAFIKTPLPRVPIAADAPATVKKKKNLLCCTSCPYKTMHGCDMKAHSKMHEDPPRLYPCSSCTYSAMRVNALRTHELLHTGVQPQHIRIVTEPALAATTVAAIMSADVIPSASSITASATIKKAAAESAAKDAAQIAKEETPAVSNGATNDEPLKKPARHINKPSEIGTVWRDTEEPEVTLRIIFDRSTRFIGEKRCKLSDYESENDSKKDDNTHYYRCVYCYDKFPRYSTLFEHMRDHFSSKRGKTSYTCKDCDFTTDKLVHIRNHKSDCTKSEWIGSSSTTAGENGASISPPPALAEEEDDDANESKGGSQEKENKEFKCTDCPYSATTYAKLWHHIQKHKKSSRFSCTKCTFSTGAIHCLQAHLRLHTATASGELSPGDSSEDELMSSTTSNTTAGGAKSAMDFCEFTLPEELTRTAPARATLPALLASRAIGAALQLEKEDDEAMPIDEKDDNEDAAPQLDEYPPILTTYGADGTEELSPAKSLTLEGGYEDEATDVAPRTPLDDAPIIEPAVADVAVADTESAAKPETPSPPPPPPPAPTRKRKSAAPKVNAPEREFRMCTRKKHLQTSFATTRRSTAAERGVAVAPTTSDAATTSAKSTKSVTFDAKTAIGGIRKGKPIKSRLRLIHAKDKLAVPIEQPTEQQPHKRPRLQCNDCPFETTERLNYRLHVELHNKSDRPFKCNVCTYNCYTPESLYAHLSLHAPPLSPTSAQALRRRRYAGQPPPPTNVSLAAASALIGPSAASISVPLASGGSSTPVDDNAGGGSQNFLQCPQCRFNTTHQDKFLLHRMKHVQLLQQRLSTTIKRAQAQATTDAVRKKQTGNGTSNSARAKSRHIRRIERMHVCTHCSFKCDTATAYSRHLEFHGARNVRFRCTLCDYGAQTHNVVLFHERNHHQDGSVTAMYTYMNERKRVEEHNRNAEKAIIAAKQRLLDGQLTARKTDESINKSPSPNSPPSEPNGNIANESLEAQSSASNTPTTDGENETAGRFQMKPGQFRCVKCDLIFFDQYDFGRHWDDRHVNVANATAHDIEIGAKLRLGLVPRNSMRVVC